MGTKMVDFVVRVQLPVEYSYSSVDLEQDLFYEITKGMLHNWRSDEERESVDVSAFPVAYLESPIRKHLGKLFDTKMYMDDDSVFEKVHVDAVVSMLSNYENITVLDVQRVIHKDHKYTSDLLAFVRSFL